MSRTSTAPSNLMQNLYPRLIGGLALLWAMVLQRGALDWSSDTVWALFVVAWLGASVALVAGWRTAPAAAVLAVLAMLCFLGPGWRLNDVIALFWWLGLAIAVTDRRPLERALLVRVTVTTAYGFACLSKINPSFLSGEQISALAIERAQLEPFEALLRSDVSIALAWGVVLAEGALAVALWFPRTRLVAAVGGALMSAVFIFAAHNSTAWDIAFIIVLTMLLVVSYLAFFCPIRAEEEGEDGGATLTGVEHLADG